MFELEIGELLLGIVGIPVIAALLILSLYVVRQYEKVAVIRFGKIIKIADTGIHLKNPISDSLRRVDMRMQTLDLRGQQAITKDTISVGLDAVVFMKVEDPTKVILNIKDYEESVMKYAQTSMRTIIGQYTLDELLTSREKITDALKAAVDELSQDWGIDIVKIELQEINLPQNMQRAFAVQAEASRESEAIIIKSKAELEASMNLQNAAKNLSNKNAIQLRILETIKQVSKDNSNTIIFALPTETLKIGVGGLAAMASINSSATRTKNITKKTEEEQNLAKSQQTEKEEEEDNENIDEDNEDEEEEE